MEALYFNVSPGLLSHPAHHQVNNGFLEGIVRGLKNSLLTQSQYHNLTQCENLEGTRDLAKLVLTTDFRMQLSTTDYGTFLANEPLPLSTATIADKVGIPTTHIHRISRADSAGDRQAR